MTSRIHPPATREEAKKEENALDAEAKEAAEKNLKKAEAEAEREREEKLAEANLSRGEESIFGIGTAAIVGLAGIGRESEEDRFERQYGRERIEQLNTFRLEQARINKEIHEAEEQKFRHNNPDATQEDIDNLRAQQRLRAREAEVRYRCSQLDSDAIGRYEKKLTAKYDQTGLDRLERFHAYHTTDPYGRNVDPSLAHSAEIWQGRRYQQMHRELAIGKRELWSIEAERQLRGLPPAERDKFLKTHLGEKYKSEGFEKDAKALGKKGSFQKANEGFDKTGNIHVLRQNAYDQFRKNNMVAYQRFYGKFGGYYQQPSDGEFKAFQQRFIDRRKIHAQAIKSPKNIPFVTRIRGGPTPGSTRVVNVVNNVVNKVGRKNFFSRIGRSPINLKSGLGNLAKKISPINLKPSDIIKKTLLRLLLGEAIGLILVLLATLGIFLIISNFGNRQTPQTSAPYAGTLPAQVTLVGGDAATQASVADIINTLFANTTFAGLAGNQPIAIIINPALGCIGDVSPGTSTINIGNCDPVALRFMIGHEFGHILDARSNIASQFYSYLGGIGYIDKNPLPTYNCQLDYYPQTKPPPYPIECFCDALGSYIINAQWRDTYNDLPVYTGNFAYDFSNPNGAFFPYYNFIKTFVF